MKGGSVDRRAQSHEDRGEVGGPGANAERMGERRGSDALQDIAEQHPQAEIVDLVIS